MQQDIWLELREALEGEGIFVGRPRAGRARSGSGALAERLLLDRILPVITPQAIDPAHPFPLSPMAA
jgi:polyphosphate kinase